MKSFSKMANLGGQTLTAGVYEDNNAPDSLAITAGTKILTMTPIHSNNAIIPNIPETETGFFAPSPSSPVPSASLFDVISEPVAPVRQTLIPLIVFSGMTGISLSALFIFLVHERRRSALK